MLSLTSTSVHEEKRDDLYIASFELTVWSAVKLLSKTVPLTSVSCKHLNIAKLQKEMGLLFQLTRPEAQSNAAKKFTAVESIIVPDSQFETGLHEVIKRHTRKYKRVIPSWIQTLSDDPCLLLAIMWLFRQKSTSQHIKSQNFLQNAQNIEWATNSSPIINAYLFCRETKVLILIS